MRRTISLLAALTFAMVACSAGPTDPTATDPVERDFAGGGGARVRLTRIVDLSMPIAMAMRSNDPTAMYIAEQGGRIVRVRNGKVTGTVLDISGIVRSGGEEGLLGMAFSPNGNRLYVYHTDNGGDNDVASYPMEGRRALAAQRRHLLEIPHPYNSNHNGGAIQLNPRDGFLYIATGDGGGQGDPGENAQDRSSLLGKILRIDPTRGSPYASPPGNPYVGRPGRDEIFHLGFRNPWRIAIDVHSQVLWIADVGQDRYEEINRVPLSVRGGNFGWDRMEGNATYEGSAPANHRRPTHVYRNDSNNRCAVTGGYQLRDERFGALRGRYVYSDYCDGVVRTLHWNGSRWESNSLGVALSGLASFGRGPGGRLFAMSHGNGGVYRIDPR